MNELLKQARMAWEKTIAENSVEVTIYRMPLKDNGFDKMVPDPFGVKIPVTMTVRISHEAKVTTGHGVTGYSEGYERYVMVNRDDTILTGDVFDAIGKTWRIGVVDPIYRFEGLIGFRAPLHEATKAGTDS